MQNATPIFLSIIKIDDENENVKTFYIKGNLNAEPGQFVMLWLPGIDQKPFSISGCEDNQFALTIFKRGPLTEKLFTLSIGDKVGITGPFGTSFSLKPNTNYFMVAGGYGAAPLFFLSQKLQPLNSQIDFFLGARSDKQLLFLNKIKSLQNTTLHLATDDGSIGEKGFVTERLENKLITAENKAAILVCTCGPELMEKKVLDLSNKYDVDAQISIERYMKCGIGVCGQCCVDPIGLCMCTNGPVVGKFIANQITEFGKYHRDKSGAKLFY
jgi:dihydroorotate dehydrogenase electron transfer subunit